jgi:hypothetical protein
MSPAPSLDDVIHAKILAYTTEQKASISCRSWKDQLYESLQLDHRIRFKKQLALGPVAFSYNAVRPLGEDFEESCGYNFEFARDGSYTMQWARTFDAWSSQSEQQFGHWSIAQDHLFCETLDPNRPVGDREVRFAPAGYKFSVAIDDILDSKGTYFQERTGAPPKPWEKTARTGLVDENSSVLTQGMWQTETAEASPAEAPAAGYSAAPAPAARLRAEARFVEIDGEMHEVSGDIVASRPEEQWAQLMKCRLRFGING